MSTKTAPQKQSMKTERIAVHDDPSPQPNVVRVSMPKEVAFDRNRYFTVIEEVMGRLGCPTCTSGHTLVLQQELEFIADMKGKVHSFTDLVGRG